MKWNPNPRLSFHFQEEFSKYSHLTLQRRILRTELFSSRGTHSPGEGWLVACPICKGHLRAFDMHEVILTRGMIQRAPDLIKEMCHVRENCVLVHPGECHIQAGTREGKEKCIHQLVHFEGKEKIFNWLQSMRVFLPQVA